MHRADQPVVSPSRNGSQSNDRSSLRIIAMTNVRGSQARFQSLFNRMRLAGRSSYQRFSTSVSRARARARRLGVKRKLGKIVSRSDERNVFLFLTLKKIHSSSTNSEWNDSRSNVVNEYTGDAYKRAQRERLGETIAGIDRTREDPGMNRRRERETVGGKASRRGFPLS